MKLETYTGGLAATNAYLLTTENATILFDAPEGVHAWLQEMGVTISHLILTHQHWDHSYDAAKFKDVEVYAFSEYDKSLTIEDDFNRRYGMGLKVEPFTVNKTIGHNETFSIEGTKFKALHVPGHSPDSLAFYNKEENLCISGDVIMMESTGRVDLPGGDSKQLRDSIEKVLLKLPPETSLFPGHGEDSLVEQEIAYNPYKTYL